MDYGKFTLEELKKGYRYDKGKDSYLCHYCEQNFPADQVFQIENKFYVAEQAAVRHLQAVHGSNLAHLLYADTKYNTLTENQKELFSLFYSAASDKEIAKKLNVAEATIRRQRFTFREKAKQARFYLAMYEQVFTEDAPADGQIVPIHQNAVYVDDRYLTTEEERQQILASFFSSFQPLVLKSFSAKEKKKVVILGKIAEQFERGKRYAEKEVNEILKPIFADYMTIRRYLIMYGFMERTIDGAQYWTAE